MKNHCGLILTGIIILVLALSLVAASHTAASYDYLIGTDFLEGFGPVITKAPMEILLN